MAGSYANGIADNRANSGEVVELEFGPEFTGRRIRQLQREARGLAREQIEGFAGDLEKLAARAAEIADGGEAYPVGARELAARIADDLGHKAQILVTILRRTA